MPQAVKPIPDGYHTITPYLYISGAAKALEFYARAFGAQELFRMPTPEGKIGHAEMKIGDSIFMLADECPQMDVRSPKMLGGTTTGFLLYVKDVDVAFQRAVDAGATATKPLENMFWGDRMGQVADPFGHTWSLATHIEDVPPDELQRRAEAAMKQPSETAQV